MHYNSKSTLMNEFLKHPDTGKLVYKPWMFALINHMQIFVYLLFEIRMKLFPTLQFERELFDLEDGG